MALKNVWFSMLLSFSIFYFSRERPMIILSVIYSFIQVIKLVFTLVVSIFILHQYTGNLFFCLFLICILLIRFNYSQFSTSRLGSKIFHWFILLNSNIFFYYSLGTQYPLKVSQNFPVKKHKICCKV